MTKKIILTFFNSGIDIFFYIWYYKDRILLGQNKTSIKEEGYVK